jgi:hypothetical protein
MMIKIKFVLSKKEIQDQFISLEQVSTYASVNKGLPPCAFREHTVQIGLRQS